MSLKHFLYRYIRTTLPFLGVLGMLIYSSQVFAQRTITYNSTPGGNFTVPFKTTSVQVQLWGAGAGGGFTGNNQGAGGGGGGAYLQVNSFVVSPGTISVTVGLGGNGQTITGTPGGAGGNSIFGTLFSNGGTGANGITGGPGGTAAVSGDLRIAGGVGVSGTGSPNTAGGNGGSGANGGGAGGVGGLASGGIGLPGSQPGGGGGGEGRSATNGGRGGDGRVILTWNCSSALTSGNPNPAPVCLGTGIGPIVYDFTGATDYTINWAPSTPSGVSVTPDAVAGTVTIQGVPTSAGTFSYTISPTYPATSTGTCSGPTSFAGSFTVTPNNTAGTISSITFCALSPLPGGVTQSTTGATGIGIPVWTPSDPGITANWASNQITFSGTPTTPGTYNYSIPMTGGCGTVNATGTITINDIPAIISQNTPGDTKCINTAFGQMSVGTGFGYTYQWYSNDTQDYTTPTLIAGATSNTYTPLSSTVGTAYYYVIVSSTSCTSVTSPVSEAYIVTPDNTAGTITSNTFCEGSPLGVVTQSTTYATGINAAGAINIPPGLTISWAADQISFTGTPTTPGTYSYSIPLTGGCGVVNATGTITINAQAAIITPSLAGQTNCLNVAFSPISVGTGPGFTYQWYSNNTPDYDTPNLISGATNNSYPPLSSIAGTTYYYVEVTSASCGTTATSVVSGAFLVNPLPAVTFTAQPVGPDVCVDTDVTYETQSGQLNYVWTIPGTAGTDYSITSGGNGSNSLVIKWLTSGNKSVSVNWQDASGCGSTAAVSSNTINVQKNTVSVSSNPTPVFCINQTITAFTHNTTIATSIGAPSGLPTGITASFNSNTITISGTPTVSGIFNYTIPLIGCGAVNATGTITVTPNNTVSAPSSTPTLCISTPLTNITHSTTVTTGIGAATGLPAGVTASWAGNTITISGTPTASGTFNYTIPLIGCGAVNATGTITVTPNNTVSAPSSTPTLCISTPLTNITHSTTGATGIGPATGLPAGVTASWVGNTITITGTPTVSGTFNYSIPLIGCGAVNATGTIIVRPNNTVSAPSSTPSRCINTSLTAITHTTTGATGIGAATGLPAGVTASWATNTITISGTPTVSGTFNYSIPLTGGCGTAVATGTITVSPNNTVSAPSTTPTLCINTALTPITHTTTGSNGIGTVTGLPAGVTASRAGNTITISGTPTASGTFNYSIPLTGGCGTVIATGTITVTPNNTIGAASSTPTLCINTALTNITHTTTGATGIGVATGLPAGVTASWSGNTITISGTPTASGTFNYSIPLTGGCNTPAVNATGTITVTPNNTVSAPSSTPTLCINIALTPITHTTTGATGIGTATGLPAGVTATWAGNTITISGTPTASGTFNYSIPLTGGCNNPSVNATGTITVTPNKTVSAPSSTPTLCINIALTPITHTTTGATGIGTATGLPTGVTASWAGNTITISGTPTASGTFNYSIPLTGGCGTADATGTITVNPATTITSESLAAQTICDGQNFTSISINATGTGTLTYQWYTNTTNNNTTGTAIAGAISSSYTPPSSPIGTKYYYVIVSSNCGPSVTSTISGAFTVDPITSITTPPSTANQVECFGDGFDPISVSANGANLTFQWYRNSTSSNSGGISIPGANSASFTPPSNSQGTAFYYVVVTGNCGILTSDVSGSFTVTAPATTITQNPSTTPQIICLGDSFNSISVIAIGEGTVTYQWYSNSSASNSGGTLISGAISQAYTPLSGTVGTTYYYAVANSDCGTVPTAVSGAFTVNPLTAIDSESLTGATICEGNGPFSTISVSASGTGTLNYQWYSNTSNSNSGGSVIPSANTNSFTPPSNVVGPAPVYYYVVVSSTGGCGPSKTSTVSGAFIVNPNNTASAASTSPTLCINTAIPTITHNTANATGISNSGVSGANGLPAGVSASWASNTITISGTPTVSGTFNYSIPLTGGCGTVSATGTITVNPDATVGPTSVASPSVCISSPNLAPFTQPTTGVTSIGAPTGLPPGITASFNSSNGLITFSGTATTTGLYNYSIPLMGPCINGLTATGTIDVTPVYDITAVSSVSATTIGGSGTVTFYADPTKMLNGTYKVTYQIKQASGAFTTVGPVDAIVVNGKGTFSTIPITSNVDTYTVQILTIRKSTDVCTVTLPVTPTTYFGVCSAVYGGNSTFYVPANVYSITIEVYGGGGGGGTNGGGGGGAYSIRQNIPVTPGEPLAVFIGSGGDNTGTDGGVSYVTRDSNLANQLTNSLLYANGGKGSTTGNAAGGTFDPRFSGINGINALGSNGGDAGGPLGGAAGSDGVNGSAPGGGGGKKSGTRGVGGTGLVVISYSCPDADNTDCIKVIDDGSKSGITVLEFTCDDTWTAPEGLLEFTTYVGSGGGGGGSGEGSGGGGSGSIIKQTFTTTNPYGLPAGATFPITVGQGGLGAQTINANGFGGEPSTFTGNVNGSAVNIFVPGGGGGGSQSANAGGNGSSGGGGGASPSPAKSEGLGGTAVPITYSGTNVTVYQGNEGGNGDYSEPQNSVAGGGGGGLIPWKPLPADDGQNGKAAGNGQGEGGRGGDGIVLTFGDSVRYFGAGGGGIGRYFNGTDKIGLGGTADSIRIGGSGNLSGTTPVGFPGVNKTGSGGGAGYYGGGRGGNGVVYITYNVFRILPVEFLYFNAIYQNSNRSGELKWATAKEWETSHFEIERSVNDTRNWTKVGEVTGKGYSDVPVEYSFTDLNVPASGGNIFYRLKQVDLDADFAYSVTRAIQVEGLEGSTSWIAYPNPSAMRSSITVDLLDRSGYADESILIRISDARGIFESYSVSSPDEVSSVVNSYLEEARPGLHILQLIWGTKSEQLKLIRN